MGMERSYDILWSIAATCIFIYETGQLRIARWGIYVVFVILMIGVNLRNIVNKYGLARRYWKLPDVKSLACATEN